MPQLMKTSLGAPVSGRGFLLAADRHWSETVGRV